MTKSDWLIRETVAWLSYLSAYSVPAWQENMIQPLAVGYFVVMADGKVQHGYIHVIGLSKIFTINK